MIALVAPVFLHEITLEGCPSVRYALSVVNKVSASADKVLRLSGLGRRPAAVTSRTGAGEMEGTGRCHRLLCLQHRHPGAYIHREWIMQNERAFLNVLLRLLM